ncbi:propanediol utilization protein [archaeon]|jgi:putative phosphotransacetylase|nr:propanediol utilization protein [archaeon]MBT4373708.1 propanediol utilization protein [archaeon]MBT4531762.1 propanediol utilization protein [archaeon]MBT7001874.1 propanediol utilization protein [archaeon]MBT7281859.1 propanediol utilization protein [archaeon]
MKILKTKIPIEISGRHIHLSETDMKILFGKDHKLNPIKMLSQKGEFSTIDKVKIKNKNNELKLLVLGPLRKKSQIEISLTDAYNLKLSPLPEIRISGNLFDTSKIIVYGPEGKIKSSIIIAKNHLHLSKEDAIELKLKDKQKINIQVDNKRKIIFQDVIVRIKEGNLALHLDTDEGNAAGIAKNAFGKILYRKK